MVREKLPGVIGFLLNWQSAALDPGLPEAHDPAFLIQEQGFVTHFSVLCVFVLTEREDPMESIGHSNMEHFY